ncbi:hypothetical protein NDU88_004259 [Pleurodeles waltl]|uniref:Uncharacterized protein n=1 Tax=Pleurodeles waltl TaxID=8319 RepID=A0AAV7RGQ2_PLEWA|nr:hypothetical protein NDU88_004259 [Pleurodeles waltl]
MEAGRGRTGGSGEKAGGGRAGDREVSGERKRAGKERSQQEKAQQEKGQEEIEGQQEISRRYGTTGDRVQQEKKIAYNKRRKRESGKSTAGEENGAKIAQQEM